MSTYFEGDPPEDERDLRRFGYSRDKRGDCVQLVIALVVTVTPEGFPLAYEILPGNTADKTTLREFLQKIQDQCGKTERVWVTDRCIPTEEVLEEMRRSDPPIYYLVGTPKCRLGSLDQPWAQVLEGVEVKLLLREDELYVLAQIHARVCKERAMRQRQLKKLWKRLKQLQGMTIKHD